MKQDDKIIWYQVRTGFHEDKVAVSAYFVGQISRKSARIRLEDETYRTVRLSSLAVADPAGREQNKTGQ